MANIRSHKELGVYQAAIEAAVTIFEVTRTFPPEEKYSRVYAFTTVAIRSPTKVRSSGWPSTASTSRFCR